MGYRNPNIPSVPIQFQLYGQADPRKGYFVKPYAIMRGYSIPSKHNIEYSISSYLWSSHKNRFCPDDKISDTFKPCPTKGNCVRLSEYEHPKNGHVAALNNACLPRAVRCLCQYFCEAIKSTTTMYEHNFQTDAYYSLYQIISEIASYCPENDNKFIAHEFVRQTHFPNTPATPNIRCFSITRTTYHENDPYIVLHIQAQVSCNPELNTISFDYGTPFQFVAYLLPKTDIIDNAACVLKNGLFHPYSGIRLQDVFCTKNTMHFMHTLANAYYLDAWRDAFSLPKYSSDQNKTPTIRTVTVTDPKEIETLMHGKNLQSLPVYEVTKTANMSGYQDCTIHELLISNNTRGQRLCAIHLDTKWAGQTSPIGHKYDRDMYYLAVYQNFGRQLGKYIIRYNIGEKNIFDDFCCMTRAEAIRFEAGLKRACQIEAVLHKSRARSNKSEYFSKEELDCDLYSPSPELCLHLVQEKLKNHKFPDD